MTVKLAHGSWFTVHDSQLTVHDSRFAVHGSRFTIRSSRFTIRREREGESEGKRERDIGTGERRGIGRARGEREI